MIEVHTNNDLKVQVSLTENTVSSLPRPVSYYHLGK